MSTGWALLAKNDLISIFNLFKLNSSSYADNGKEYPYFIKWFYQGLEKSMNLSKKVKDYIGYKYVIQYYLNGFRDGHMQCKFNNCLKTKDYEWADIIVRYENSNFIIIYANKKYGNIVGSKIIKCNSYNTKTYMNKYKLPYLDTSGYPTYHESCYINWSHTLFFNNNPFIKNIKSIIIEKNKKEKLINLEWNIVTGKELDKILHKFLPFHYEVINKQFCHKIKINFRFKFKIHEFGKKNVWIVIPTWNPETEDEIKYMKFIIKSIKKYRNYNTIIFDIRGNGGGNSQWSEKIVRKLYSVKYLNTIPNFGNQGDVNIRVSNDIINQKYYNFDNDQINKMKKALKKRKKFIHYRSFKKQITKTKINNPVTANIFILTETLVYSTSLMFMDELLSLPNVKQIGKMTGADTAYGDSYDKILPSSLTYIKIPVKVRIGKWKRKENNWGPYIPEPKYTFHGNIYNTKEVKKWIYSKII